VRVEATAGGARRAGDRPRVALTWLRALAGRHKLFTWALAGGAVLRLFAVLGYPGALWFAGDSYVYIGAALRPQPDLSKSTGYSLFLRLLLPFHSMTLVTVVQHLMGLAVAVMIYALLRRNNVAKRWSTLATLPVLFDGYLVEDEHLIMAEALFTFLLMAGLLLIVWRGQTPWWAALIAGLLTGYAVDVRTQGAIVVVLFPLFLLVRGRAWRTVRGWLAPVLLAVGCLVPVGAYASWFHARTGQYNMTLSDGFYLWGRVSSFAKCATIKPTGREALVCPTEPVPDRTPPGTYIWHLGTREPNVYAYLHSTGGSVSPANNTLLTNFAIHAVEAQPVDYLKTVVKDVAMSFGFPRIGYPDPGTTLYYSFHLHYSQRHLLPPKNHEWIGPDIAANNAYADWLRYGGEAPGVVRKVFAIPLIGYQKIFYTWGPLLAVIFLTGLGGVFAIRRRGHGLGQVRLRWEIRGTSMLPWLTAVALLVFPIAVADFDYRYLLPVIPFACLAAGLAFAPSRKQAEEEPQVGADPMVEITAATDSRSA
jgi:hypothetical protein